MAKKLTECSQAELIKLIDDLMEAMGESELKRQGCLEELIIERGRTAMEIIKNTKQGKDNIEMWALLLEVESIEGHAKVRLFDEDLQHRISEILKRGKELYMP
jgi:hypothetical protein